MTAPSQLEHDLDQLVQRCMEAWAIPGLAVAVVKDDQVLICKGYGVRDNKQPGRVDEDTLFAIASNTKAFTASAVGMLVQEGRLKWDDRVIDILPWFRLYDEHATQLITVRDLLCHRSGLGTWSGDMLQYSDYSLEEVVRRIRHIPPSYPFRAGYGYCNLGYLTASMLITAASGLSWDDFVKQRLLNLIGMTRSVTGPRFLGRRTNVAQPHELIHGKVQTVPVHDDTGFGAAGGILSSARDLSLWLRLQLNGGCLDGRQLVDPAIIKETHTPHTILPFQPPPAEKRIFPSTHFALYGLGWFINDLHGRMLVRHTGGLDGMLSSTAMIPEENIGVAVLTNKLPNLGYMAITFYLMDRLLGIDERDWLKSYLEVAAERKQVLDTARERLIAGRAAGTHPSLPLKEFAGEYDAATLGGACLRVAGRKLHIQLEAHETLSGELMHWHYDSFMCKWDNPILGESLIPFSTDGQGHVTGFKVKIREDWIDPLEHPFKKL
jgi:CubicO group peptidase (beta-lactamase class C family)